MARPFLIFVLISMVTLLGGCASHSQGPYQLSLEQSESAMASYRSADYKEAVRQYEFLTSQVPKDANFWFYLGNAYAKDKQPQRAVMAYENALIRDKGLGKAWYNMGLLQMQQALKTFIDMQENLPEKDPARKLGREKMDALFQLLGQTK
jgi:tetratricopeptide (TPR) repeat protein